MFECNYYILTNYNNVETGYYSLTGCTGIVGVGTINPLSSEYVCGDSISVLEYGAPLTIVQVGLCPSSTPTPTLTPTNTPSSVTPTPTPSSPTPTPTITPTVTPTTYYEYNLRTGGWYQDVCNSVNQFANPANVKVFTTKPFETLQVGDYVYGNRELTIPPIGANFTISNGGRFVQAAGTLIINVGLC